VSPNDNKFAALFGRVVWRKLVYVPKRKRWNPTTAYFRINAQSWDNSKEPYVAEEGSNIHYLEACSPLSTLKIPTSAVVEIYVEKNAKVQYTTIQTGQIMFYI